MKTYYLEFIRKTIIKGESLNTFHLITKIFNNYRKADQEFKRICKLYNNETILFSCSIEYGHEYNVYDIAIKYK